MVRYGDSFRWSNLESSLCQKLRLSTVTGISFTVANSLTVEGWLLLGQLFQAMASKVKSWELSSDNNSQFSTLAGINFSTILVGRIDDNRDVLSVEG